MRISLCIAAIIGLTLGSSLFLGTGFAETEETLQRLPATNAQESRGGPLGRASDSDGKKANRPKPRKRLVAGGGLLQSFDADNDGIVTKTDLVEAVPVLFSVIDTNQNTYITALEQIAWAQALPFRDASLANPVRFDPNIDSRVTLKEFSYVMNQLFQQYASEETGTVLVADLYQIPKREDRGKKPPPPKRGDGKKGERPRNSA